jgi:hypothetical protein
MGKAEIALLAVLVSATIAALCSTSTLGTPDNWLYYYQTIIAGLLALISAIWAGNLLRRQINQGREIEDERKNGRREAARSWLSLHLSIILRHAEATGKELWELMGKCKGGKLPSNAELPEFPPIPMASAEAVKQFTEFATKDEARYIALLFASMQVLDTNVRSLKASTAAHYLENLEDYLMYAGEVYARAEALLGYARLSTEDFPKGATWERFASAMFFMTLTHEPTDRIADYIKTKSGGDLNSYLPNKFEKI